MIDVQVILDNGILYGFEMVEPIWFKRDLKSMEKSIEQTIIQPQRSLFDVNSISPRLSSKKLPIKIEPLEGMYHLKPCLFQYRNIRLVSFFILLWQRSLHIIIFLFLAPQRQWRKRFHQHLTITVVKLIMSQQSTEIQENAIFRKLHQ